MDGEKGWQGEKGHLSDLNLAFEKSLQNSKESLKQLNNRIYFIFTGKKREINIFSNGKLHGKKRKGERGESERGINKTNESLVGKKSGHWINQNGIGCHSSHKKIKKENYRIKIKSVEAI